MVSELIMLPVRVGVRATRLWFRAVEETFSITTNATGRVVELLASRSPNGTGTTTLAREAARAEQPIGDESASAAEPRTRAPERRARRPQREVGSAPAATAPAHAVPAQAEPVHVSEEPELVEEFAEPGAEQGAGAEIRVDAPWDGYEQMTAKQVVARLTTLDPAELAAVQLYESSHRHRQTILNSVDRELRSTSNSKSRTNQTRRNQREGMN